MKYLLIPTKNVALSQSILGVSSIIYNIIKNNNYSIDEVYEIAKSKYYNKHLLSYDLDFNQYVLGLCFLYSLKQINVKQNGVIICEIN